MQLVKHRGLDFLRDPRLNSFHRLYIRIFGIPISGLRIRLRRVLPAIQGDYRAILDAGCGKGIFSFELARRYPNARVVGVDTDSEQVRINNGIADESGLKNLSFGLRDILELSEESCFDLVVCVDNLEHIENDALALRNLHRALRSGGTLVCHVPAFERTWVFRGRSTNFDVPGHVRPGYRAQEIADKVLAAGFEEVQVRGTFGYLETVANNLSYLVTGASQKNAMVYALVFPLLNLLAWLGRFQPAGDSGAGVLVVARKTGTRLLLEPAL